MRYVFLLAITLFCTLAQAGAPSPTTGRISKVPPSVIEVMDFPMQHTGVKPLCEPPGHRWEYPTKAERQAVLDKVQATCDALGVEDCTYFRLISIRESGGRPWVRHKLHGDVKQARSAYMTRAKRYGWEVKWPKQARSEGDAEAMSIKPLRGKKQNPWYPEVERWTAGGLGLHGLNVVLHLAKWDKYAPPETLCDPVVSTIISIRLARRAVIRYGATTWLEVNAVFAGRTAHSEAEDGTRFYYARTDTSRDRAFIERAYKWGLDPFAKPVLGERLGISPTPDQKQLADRVRGAPLVIPEAELHSAGGSTHKGLVEAQSLSVVDRSERP